MKVLLIDSDPRVTKKLAKHLSDFCIVDVAFNGEEGEQLAYSNKYDLILAESYLPDIDGEDLCTVIKSRVNVPIIILSRSSSIADKEKVFDRGADDYIVKPVNIRELKARMKAAVRKGPSQNENEILCIRDLQLDVRKKMVTYKGQRLKLRKKEIQLLEYLLYNKGRVVSRVEILESIWDMNANPFSNTVEVHIKRLRDVLEKPFNEKYIETIHGMGYLVED